MNTIRKFVRKFGLDIHKYRKITNKFDYLGKLDIACVLDIGANTGQFAKEIRKILPKAFIYSFEPLEEAFEKLNQNTNQDKNFKAFNFALGNETKETKMQKNEYSPSSSILPLAQNHKELFPHAKKTSEERIVIKKLDDVAGTLTLQKEILIKVDVQGFEDKVIEGGKNTFSRAKAVVIETSFVELYQNQPTFDDIYMLLKGLGFYYRGSLQEKLNGVTGEIISEDSLFVR